jgi:hypothetical protein
VEDSAEKALEGLDALKVDNTTGVEDRVVEAVESLGRTPDTVGDGPLEAAESLGETTS